MESASKTAARRFNEITEDGWTLAATVILAAVLIVPVVMAWRVAGELDWMGWVALIVWEWFAIRVFKGLVYPGTWHDGD